MMANDILHKPIREAPPDHTAQHKPTRQDPPMVEAHDWSLIYVAGKERMFVGEFRNHPIKGHGRNLMTSRVMWLDRNLRLCQTRNTLYRLFKENK